MPNPAGTIDEMYRHLRAITDSDPPPEPKRTFFRTVTRFIGSTPFILLSAAIAMLSLVMTIQAENSLQKQTAKHHCGILEVVSQEANIPPTLRDELARTRALLGCTPDLNDRR